VNPYTGIAIDNDTAESFKRGFDRLLQTSKLDREWPLVVLEMRKLYVIVNRRPPPLLRELTAGNLTVREVYRVPNAISTSAPVFTTDRQGYPIFAYMNDA